MRLRGIAFSCKNWRTCTALLRSAVLARRLVDRAAVAGQQIAAACAQTLVFVGQQRARGLLRLMAYASEDEQRDQLRDWSLTIGGIRASVIMGRRVKTHSVVDVAKLVPLFHYFGVNDFMCLWSCQQGGWDFLGGLTPGSAGACKQVPIKSTWVRLGTPHPTHRCNQICLPVVVLRGSHWLPAVGAPYGFGPRYLYLLQLSLRAVGRFEFERFASETVLAASWRGGRLSSCARALRND